MFVQGNNVQKRSPCCTFITSLKLTATWHIHIFHLRSGFVHSLLCNNWAWLRLLLSFVAVRFLCHLQSILMCYCPLSLLQSNPCHFSIFLLHLSFNSWAIFQPSYVSYLCPATLPFARLDVELCSRPLLCPSIFSRIKKHLEPQNKANLSWLGPWVLLLKWILMQLFLIPTRSSFTPSSVYSSIHPGALLHDRAISWYKSA